MKDDVEAVKREVRFTVVNVFPDFLSEDEKQTQMQFLFLESEIECV
jgi:hypothetical protein